MSNKGNATVVFCETGQEYRVAFSGNMEGNVVNRGPGFGSAVGRREFNFMVISVDGTFLPVGKYDLRTDEGLHVSVQNMGMSQWALADADA